MSNRKPTYTSRRASLWEALHGDYETVAILEYNIGENQLLMASRPFIYLIAQQNDVAAPERRLEAAIKNDAIVVHEKWMAQARIDEFRAALEAENAHEEYDQMEVWELAKALVEVDT